MVANLCKNVAFKYHAGGYERKPIAADRAH